MLFPQINLKKIILVLAIVVVLNLFINYGIDTFYKQPKWDDFCGATKSPEIQDTKERCETDGGKWNDNFGNPRILKPSMEKMPVPAPEIIPETIPSGWCDREYYCRQNYENLDSVYRRNIFVILIVLGALSLSGGFFITQSEAVALGFSLGGLVSIFIGTVRYWSAMDDYLRFIVLGITLAALIWIGVKKFKNGAS